MRRVVVVCPGRGSYSRDTLGSLTQTPSVVAADAFRAALRRPTPTGMDASGWSSRLHLAGENASILTMAASVRDSDLLRDVEVVAVVGNSMGWYTALTVAGALPLDDGFRLVETLAQYQAGNVIGGQIVYPLVDDEWQPDTEAIAALEEAVAAIPQLWWSIRLGGQAVLGGTSEALAAAIGRLPARKAGDRDAPFQLPLHSAFHTPLLQPASTRARVDLADLRWQAPRVALVDGTGRVWRPRSADPAALARYTLTTQVVSPYDFATSARVALAEYAPDAVVLLGPGGNLGGAVGQVLAQEGWSGVHTKSDFVARQAASPFVLAMARPEQRALVT
jgi:[acyl-carrier-protein] S-malonyltransferase